MDYKNFKIKINQILEREILDINEITSIEMVILMNDLNEFFKTGHTQHVDVPVEGER